MTSRNRNTFPTPDYFYCLVMLIYLVAVGCGRTGKEVEKCLENNDCIASVKILKISETLPLDPLGQFWSSPGSPKKVTIDLNPQMITNPKWPDPSVKKVNVAGVRNQSKIAILLEWDDATPDNLFGHSDRFTDQAAIMFPVHPKSEPPSITMGGVNEPVNIWQWKAIWEKKPDEKNETRAGKQNIPPPRNSPVEDLNAEGFSTLTIQNHQNVQGKGVWKDNRWHVVFTRSLTNGNSNDIQFEQSVQMGIAVWNGSNKERNGQKGIGGWILLKFS